MRYIARSDGSVAMALPTIAIRDDAEVLALYVPPNTTAKDNAVDNLKPSRERQHLDRTWPTPALRLYLPGQAFSVWLFFNEQHEFTGWYGNLEAPFIRTRLGVDTRDHTLDVVATPDGRWRWKDEEEFARRLAVGIDSAEHQAAVRAAGVELIARLEQRSAPFDQGWEWWRPPAAWQPRNLPVDWATDFGIQAVLR